MKIKMNLYISDPESFARDPKSNCYSITPHRWMDKDWTFCGEVELEVNVDNSAIIETAKRGIDGLIGQHTAAINVLENRKAELLALPSPS